MDADEYADLRSALDYAEIALEAGDAQEALGLAQQVVLRVGGRSTDDLLPSARLTVGRALLAIGRTNEAITVLEQVAGDSDAALQWARAAMTLTWCYTDVGELDRAIAVGERISRELRDRGLGDTDDAIKLQVTLASAYWMQGDVRYAKRVCRRAIDAADRIGSPEAQASAYWNTSLYESHEGAVEAAIPLAQHALCLFQEVGNHTYAAQLRGLLGIMFLRRDPPDLDSAIPMLEQAVRELAWTRAGPSAIGDIQVYLAKARFLSGDMSGAEELLDGALQTAASGAPFVKASALVLRGQVQASRGLVGNARDTYQSAVMELTAVGADRQAAQLWFELGNLLAEFGEADDARDAFKRAAATTGSVQARPRRFLSPG